MQLCADSSMAAGAQSLVDLFIAGSLFMTAPARGWQLVGTVLAWPATCWGQPFDCGDVPMCRAPMEFTVQCNKAETSTFVLGKNTPEWIHFTIKTRAWEYQKMLCCAR